MNYLITFLTDTFNKFALVSSLDNYIVSFSAPVSGDGSYSEKLVDGKRQDYINVLIINVHDTKTVSSAIG